MLEDDPEFLAAVERARDEIHSRQETELCQHGHPKFNEKGWPDPCPACKAAADAKASGFWNKAKTYMDGVKPIDDNMPGPKNTSFTETPGFDIPESTDQPAS